MSLDVRLQGESVTEDCECTCGHKHTRTETVRLYDANITHNLNAMAGVAGVYQALWRPEEIGVTHAKQLIPLLRQGLDRLLEDPKKFEPYNPKNGWGSYSGLVSFAKGYLAACEEYPDATVYVSR